MNAWVRRSLQAGALTAGAVMSAGTAAYADSTLISADNTGLLNGTQVFAPIQAPINLCGIAAAVGGTATAGCEGGSTAIQGLQDVKMISAGNTGILNGTQVYAPIQAPINLCGVAVAVLGDATAGCEGGSTAIIGKGGHGRGDHHGGHHGCNSGCDGNHGYRGSTESTSPKAEVLGSVTGLTQNLPLVGGLTQNLPLVGNLTQGGLPLVGGLTQGGGLPVVGPLVSSLPLVGNLLGGGGATNMVDVDALDSVGVVPRSQNESARVTESEGEYTDGGVGGGTGCGTTCPTPPTTPPPPTQPCPPGHGHGHGGHGHGGHGGDVKMISTGNVGILNGTQIYAPIQIPIDVSGIAVGVLGDAAAWSEGGATARM